MSNTPQELAAMFDDLMRQNRMLVSPDVGKAMGVLPPAPPVDVSAENERRRKANAKAKRRKARRRRGD